MRRKIYEAHFVLSLKSHNEKTSAVTEVFYAYVFFREYLGLFCSRPHIYLILTMSRNTEEASAEEFDNLLPR